MRAGFTYALAGALVATALAVLVNLPGRLLGPADGGRPVRIAGADGTTIEAAPPRARPAKPQAHSTPKTHTATVPAATHIASLNLAAPHHATAAAHAATATPRATTSHHAVSHPAVHTPATQAAKPITARLPKSIRARSAVVTHLTTAPKRRKVAVKPAAKKRTAKPTTTATTTTAVPAPTPSLPPVAAVNAPVATTSSSSPAPTSTAAPATAAAPAAPAPAPAPSPAAAPAPTPTPVALPPIVTHVQTGRSDNHDWGRDGDHGHGWHR